MIDLQIGTVERLGNGRGHFTHGDGRIRAEAEMIVGQGEELRVDNGLDLRGGGQVDAVLGGGDDVCRGNGVGACGIAHFLGGGFIALDPARMDIGQTEGLCQIHGRVGARIGRFCQCRGREQREHEHQDEKCGQNSFHRVTSIFSNIRVGGPRRFGRVKRAYHIFRKNARKCCKFAEYFFEFYIVFTKYNEKLPDLSLRGGQGPTW